MIIQYINFCSYSTISINIMAQYRKLVEKSLTLLQNFTIQQPLPNLVAQSNLLHELSTAPLPSHNHTLSNQIGLRSIISHPQLRLTIYKLPPRTTMKLHNHPYMNIVTYIMDGEMQAHMFNPISESKQQKVWLRDEETCQKIKRVGDQNLYQLKSKKLTKGNLQFIEGIRMPKLNNLHQFQSLEQECVFLDIIFPDYNQNHRVYRTYNYEKFSENPQIYYLSQGEDDSPEMVYI